MRFGGDPTAWLDLIDSLVPDILRLILSTWDEMPPLSPDALEDPTTEALCRALRKNRTSASLPFRIDIQMVELDPAAGEEQGRMDIAFSPMVPHEAFYFCLECKRLNVTLKGRHRTLGTEYVTQGLSRFVTRQYADQVRNGGMLGYVLDSRVDLAIAAVQTAIQTRSENLKIAGEAGLRQSSFLPEVEHVFETSHVRGEMAEQFLLQHIFVPATCPDSGRSGLSASRK